MGGIDVHPHADPVGEPYAYDPSEANVSASTHDAPPCHSPKGCVLPSTGIRPTTSSEVSSTSSNPILERTRALCSGGRSQRRDYVSRRWIESHSVPTETRPKLLLIDGHSIAYRAFFALPVENFSTVTGQHTNGVFGFTSMLINVLRDEAPTHVGVAFDVSRQDLPGRDLPRVQGEPVETPDEFSGQLDLVKEVLKALNIAFVEKEGFEADDVIGTLATRAEALGFEVLICTGDRDAFQLVTENVTVLYPRKGVSDLGRMTPKAVEERYFATPARYPELAALVGESSDNLPGVPGVGPKTAAKWLEMYDGLENLAAHAGELKGKAAEAFQERIERCAPQSPDQRAGARPRPAARPGRHAASAVEPGGDPSAVRRTGVPGAPRPAAGGACPTRRRSCPRAAST